MIRINLLPKEDVPVQRNLTLPDLGTFAPLVLVAVAAVGLAVAHVYQNQKIGELKQTIAEEQAVSMARLGPRKSKT